MTTQNLNKFVAFVIDDEIYGCPRIMKAIDRGIFRISGGINDAEALDLSYILKCGRLPMPMKVIIKKQQD